MINELERSAIERMPNMPEDHDVVVHLSKGENGPLLHLVEGCKLDIEEVGNFISITDGEGRGIMMSREKFIGLPE